MDQPWNASQFFETLPRIEVGPYRLIDVVQEEPNKFECVFEPTNAALVAVPIEELLQTVTVHWHGEQNILSLYQISQTGVPVSESGSAMQYLNDQVNATYGAYPCKACVVDHEQNEDCNVVVVVVGWDLAICHPSLLEDKALPFLRALVSGAMVNVVLGQLLIVNGMTTTYLAHVRTKTKN